MKTGFIHILALVICIFTSAAAIADDSSEPSTGPAQLIAKLELIENELSYLKMNMDYLITLIEDANEDDLSASQNWGCYISNFSKTYVGTGASQALAKGKALQKCGETETSGCLENKVKCTES